MKSYRIITLLIIFMLLFSLNIDVSSGAIAPHLDQAGNGDVPYRIAAPDSWWIDVIDETAANIGEYPSLAIDQKDYPHIAYTDASNSRLVYYYQDQFGDHFERFSASQGTGNFPSLKLDEYGRAHIGYLDTTYDHLYYTYQDGSGNFTPGEDVAGDVGFSFLNLGFDEDDDPIFSYYEKSNQNLRFAYRGPHYPPWYTLKLAHYSQNLDVGKWASMAVDKNGFPHLSYSNETQGNLMYVYKDFGGWRQPITIDSPGNVGMHTSLALDQYGNPHISYLEWEYLGLSGYYYYLKYAYRDLFGQWHIEMVDDEGTAGEYSSIAIDNAGRPHISYYDHYGGDLLYATRDSNGTWYRYYVDDIGDVGIDSDIALDSNGNPRIAYYEAFGGSSGRLKYAAFTPPVSPFSANTGCAWGSHDCNPCVRNVVSAFNNLSSRGDILGFHMNGAPEPHWSVSTTGHNHWQGIQRLASGDGRNMVITLDTQNTPTWKSLFEVIQLGSRNAQGERLRSNRLAWHYDFDQTAPSTSDRVTSTYWFEHNEKHPGGIQAMGNILAVGSGPIVNLYDLSVPSNPQKIGPTLPRGDKTGSTSALAQLSDDRYLLVVSEGDARSLDFYVTSNLYAGFSHWDEWTPNELDWDEKEFFYGWDTFQNLNLVSDCASGKLYLVGTGNLDKTVPNCDYYDWLGIPCLPAGEDWASLYEISYSGSEFSLTKVAERHFYCQYRDQKQCNFDAAAGIYVDPNHQLYLYSSEHDNDGPQGTVKLMEFGPMWGSGSCHTSSDAWVELYEGPFFNGRSIRIDFLDKDLRDYSNYDEVEDFEDKAASVRWCLPQDWSYILHEHKKPCGGTPLALTGSGTPHLKLLWNSNLGVEASCSEFNFDPPRVERYNPNLGVTIVYYYPGGASSSLTEAEGDPVIADQTVAETRSISLEVPKLAFTQPVTVTLAPVSPPVHETAPLDYTGYGFRLWAQGDDLVPEEALLAEPAQVSIQFNGSDVTSLNQQSLSPYYWDSMTQSWIPAEQTCSPETTSTLDVGNNILETSVCKLGEYAVLGNQNPVKVLVDESHNNLLTLDWNRAQDIADTRGFEAQPEWYHIGDLKAFLAGDYSLSRTTSPLTSALLSSYDILVMPNYEGDLSIEEVTAVKSFVAGGGGLILLGDCSFYNPDPELASMYGVEFNPHCLFSPAPELRGDIPVTQIEDHPAVSGASGMTLNWSQSLKLTGQAQRLASSDPYTWRDENGNDVYDEGQDPVRQFEVGAAYDTGCGRVAALGDNTFSDADLQWTDNERLFESLLRWTSSGKSCSLSADMAPKKILVDEAHNNQKTLDWERAVELAEEWGPGAMPEWASMGKLRGLLAADFDLERHVGSKLTEEVLAGYEALMIPYYWQAMDPGEVTAIQRYVAQGGGLIFLGDCGYQSPNPELLSSFGVSLDPNCLLAPSTTTQNDIPIYSFADHAAVEGLNETVLNYAQTLQVGQGAEWLVNTALVDSWVDENYNDVYDEGEGGVFDVAAAYDQGCGRVVITGDETISDADLEWTDNDVLMRSLLSWITGGQTCSLGYDVFLPQIQR